MTFFRTSCKTLALAKADLAKGPSPPAGKWDTNLSFDETCQIIGKGFAGTDSIPPEPLTGWMVSSHISSIDSPTRRELFQFFMAFPIDESRRKEHLFVGKRTDDGALSTAMVVTQYRSPRRFNSLLPSFKKLHELSLIIKLSRNGSVPELFTSKVYEDDERSFTAKSDAIVRAQAQWHTEFGPSESHWYIHVFATDPDFQGQGHGSQLLRRVCELADAHEVDCYLEAGSPRNRDLYERFGFRSVATKMLEDPLDPEKGEPLTMYLMTRQHNNAHSSRGSETQP